MYISVFDIFKIGIGPSSSHTVGPMKAALAFTQQLAAANLLQKTARVEAALYGSLALTGKGHGTDKAILLGLMGEQPNTIEPDTIEPRLNTVYQQKALILLGQHRIPFDETHLQYHQQEVLPCHTNGLRLTATDHDGQKLLTETYYSLGGGFIVTAEQFNQPVAEVNPVPYPFTTAEELLTQCRAHSLTISQLMMANEITLHTPQAIRTQLLEIANVMKACIQRGCATNGILPGGLELRRRAPALYAKLMAKGKPNRHHPDVMNWLNVYAMAVNEENAAGGRIVTAPTNGAAGIIPAVLQYYRDFCEGSSEQGIVDFLLTAAAIAILYKLRASISGAEVGCQGEVGVACSMAAGALAAVLNGSLAQVENAAEIGMEHNLGLPCDPPKGLVQIPCIERNAMGAVKAINAAQLALAEDGQHRVSLDAVINTMRQIGKDMMTIYKETSLGGLAVNVPEC